MQVVLYCDSTSAENEQQVAAICMHCRFFKQYLNTFINVVDNKRVFELPDSNLNAKLKESMTSLNMGVLALNLSDVKIRDIQLYHEQIKIVA